MTITPGTPGLPKGKGTAYSPIKVKDPTSLEDYLGVQIVQSDDGKKARLG